MKWLARIIEALVGRLVHGPQHERKRADEPRSL